VGKRMRGILLVGTGLLAMVGTSWGQTSESEMRDFPMPPAQGYAAEKVFTYTGDYGYYLFPSSSFPDGGSSPSDYEYVRYTGLSGKRVYVYGAWGDTPIPPRPAMPRDTLWMLVDMPIAATASGGNMISPSLSLVGADLTSIISRDGSSWAEEERVGSETPPANASCPLTTT
jgi:hypothetical protein